MVGCSLLQTSDRSQKATELVFLLEFSTSIPVFPRATAAFSSIFPHLLMTHFPQNGSTDLQPGGGPEQLESGANGGEFACGQPPDAREDPHGIAGGADQRLPSH